MEKILITRFSSFGDVVQAMVCLEALHRRFPESKIHWVCRSEFRPLIENHPLVEKVFDLKKGSKFSELQKLIKDLKKENYSHFYDAHNNTRSNLISFFFLWQRITGKIKYCQRPKNRFKRFLLFNFKINLFPWPFVLMKSYLKPLKNWGVDAALSKNKHIYLEPSVFESAKKELHETKDYIVLAPSAAWELKRWPIEYWQELINRLPNENIVLLGGPEDHFIEDLVKNAKPRRARLLNLAGKLSFAQSCSVIENAKHIVGGDSGLTHVGDSFAVPSSLIIGAAAFAYPARKSTKILDHKLACKPCSKDGRGKCKNTIYKECLFGLSPDEVLKSISPEKFKEIPLTKL
ncbi:MAG: heptosyltransferase [Bdellovibrionaceae bacterium]|nr:heptosyltransferase [Pseudobdellovibrionaceae bacterium]|tara:strand:+ start:3989 stop:5029 length:1041 start_codon:yes stop_codon:yes gene_type:complete